MKDYNTTQCSQGLRFVQWQKNTPLHCGIGTTSYEAIYEEKAPLGIFSTSIPEEIMKDMDTKEQLAEALCLPNEEDQNIEQEERSGENCAINCNSYGQNISCHPSGPCSVVNDNADEPVLSCLYKKNQSIQTEQMESKIEKEKKTNKKEGEIRTAFQASPRRDTVMVPIPIVDRR